MKLTIRTQALLAALESLDSVANFANSPSIFEHLYIIAVQEDELLIAVSSQGKWKYCKIAINEIEGSFDYENIGVDPKFFKFISYESSNEVEISLDDKYIEYHYDFNGSGVAKFRFMENIAKLPKIEFDEEKSCAISPDILSQVKPIEEKFVIKPCDGSTLIFGMDLFGHYYKESAMDVEWNKNTEHILPVSVGNYISSHDSKVEIHNDHFVIEECSDLVHALTFIPFIQDKGKLGTAGLNLSSYAKINIDGTIVRNICKFASAVIDEKRARCEFSFSRRKMEVKFNSERTKSEGSAMQDFIEDCGGETDFIVDAKILSRFLDSRKWSLLYSSDKKVRHLVFIPETLPEHVTREIHLVATTT